MLAYLKDNKVFQLVQEVDPIFPGIAPEERYAEAFLAQCVSCGEEVEIGWIYENGSFVEPPPDPWPDPSPEPEPEPGIPSPNEDRDALLVDLEYRMTLVELGLV